MTGCHVNIVFSHHTKYVKPTPATYSEILSYLNLPGFTFLLVSLINPILELQQTGCTLPWSSPSSIARLVFRLSNNLLHRKEVLERIRNCPLANSRSTGDMGRRPVFFLVRT